MKNEEYILCAAIWYKDFPKTVSHYMCTNIEEGVVLCGHRHHNIIGQCISLLDKRQAELGKYVQGFITSKNRFLTREEALIIALKENQVIDINEIRGNRLYSEDLY